MMVMYLQGIAANIMSLGALVIFTTLGTAMFWILCEARRG